MYVFHFDYFCLSTDGINIYLCTVLKVEVLTCALFVCVCVVQPYILYADGKISLEVVEVFCQLIAVVIVGEQALEKCQQLREQKQQEGEIGEERKGKEKDDDKGKGRRKMGNNCRCVRRGGG